MKNGKFFRTILIYLVIYFIIYILLYIKMRLHGMEMFVVEIASIIVMIEFSKILKE